ncbi:glycosyl transferase family 2 [Candidatus Uhrbacteria bacterium CG10_big_fil_rev_8_21_14_0_10_48_16]|uniref:Glycosyl transferase family 2 n=1 Tax=Candidatus Uhrbacteria bacterium CG10_big_fil_rev_8_21_14_0_10_48_16 TaxID=1975038 RepID=A0A2M8LGC3_9BACT|nr:MAG: glycosyl transferase family 2 [Candidatus Uhrbacteria bacterium CG10_big_fil_rev_8_21_14_0_10_48_16]
MLTIIIPTKNEEESLPRLLASIHRQTLQPVEIIVSDAQSSDATRDLARSFNARVVEGGLISFGRNAGAREASTEFLLFLDADVELRDPEFLEKAVGEMLEKKLDLATCDVFPLSDQFIDHFLHKAYNTYARAWGSVYPHAPGFCMLVRRSLHESIGGFDETVLFCEDHDYARRASEAGTFGFLRSTKIPVSIRRLDRDGRMNIAIKYLLAELHLAFLGPIRHNKFRYTFGHAKTKDKKQT